MRARGYITADVRNQTEYGTVRGYIAVGLNTNDVGLQVANLVDSANRAFVQWAGMTAGLSQSFFDFYSVPAMQYRGGYLPASDTGDGGWWVWAYTAQFGGGFSGTISSEARRTTQIIDANGLPGPAGTQALAGAGTIIPGGYPCAATVTGNTGVGGTAVGGCGSLFPGAGAYGGQQTMDIVANLRVDQAWGGAQIMGALHEVNASYYSAANALQSAPSTTGAGGVGHPGDKWGWAAGFGLKVNTPFITQGDWFQTQVNVTQGALRYLFNTPNSNWGKVDAGKEAYGVLSDCVYAGVGCHRQQHRLHADQRMGHQRRLRALLDPGLAHLSVRRLLRGVVWQGYRLGQRQPVLGGGLRQHACGYAGGCWRGLRQRLADLGHRLPHSMGRHQDVLPGRGSAVPEPA